MDTNQKCIDQCGSPHQLQQGLTLVELFLAVLIVGILLGWAYPGFARLLQEVRYNQSRDALVDTFSKARNEAIFNRRIVVACASNNIHSSAPECSVDQLNWSAGWMIYQECDHDTKLDLTNTTCDFDGNGEADSPERILHTFEPPDFSLTKSDDSAITFFPTGIVDRASEFRVETGDGSGSVAVTRTANIIATGLGDPDSRLTN